MITAFHTLQVPDDVRVLDEATLVIRPTQVQAIRCWRGVGGHVITLTFQYGATVDVNLICETAVAHAVAKSFEEQISRY